MQESQEIVCPHCAALTMFFVDPSEGVRQELIEDCQVCCRPIVFRVELTGETAKISAEALD